MTSIDDPCSAFSWERRLFPFLSWRPRGPMTMTTTTAADGGAARVGAMMSVAPGSNLCAAVAVTMTMMTTTVTIER
ncbi:MAG TPA: hypothetical protein VFY72_10645 [Beijerinckiaceae bacterium]|nr:hypothetical protein [Beijerinckiaceae bacterium]